MLILKKNSSNTKSNRKVKCASAEGAVRRGECMRMSSPFFRKSLSEKINSFFCYDVFARSVRRLCLEHSTLG